MAEIATCSSISENKMEPSMFNLKMPRKMLKLYHSGKQSTNNHQKRASLLNIINWYKQNQIEKRHLFLSDGWGPGGRSLPVEKAKPTKSNFTTVKEVKKPQKNDQKDQKYYALKWSIPGLFGEI